MRDRFGPIIGDELHGDPESSEARQDIARIDPHPLDEGEAPRAQLR